jgi:hypothetical protein
MRYYLGTGLISAFVQICLFACLPKHLDSTLPKGEIRSSEACVCVCVLQEEVFKEAQTCLSDAKRRLDNAVQDLDELLKVEEENLKDAPDLEEAKALLQQHETKDDDA